MHIKQLDVHNIRNLNSLSLQFSPEVNLIYGVNGSGKTSILEAIYLLSRGRSFRNRNIRVVINNESKDCTVFTRMLDEEGVAYSLGLSRDKAGKFQSRLNGEPLKTAVELANILPVQLINSDSFSLLEGGPLVRRQFLDWGVFHVEHSFARMWSEMAKCLKQRNSLLRHDRIAAEELAVWDSKLAMLAEQVTVAREAYLEQFCPVFQAIWGELSNDIEISLEFFSGWKREESLLQLLKNNLLRDRQNKNTGVGAHRADLKVQVSGKNAADLLSRGQVKLLVCAMKIAQGYLYTKLTGKHCLYLLDDLPSELDAHNRLKVGSLLQQLGAQVFITGVFESDLRASWPESENIAMFHVEHGVVKEGGAGG